MLQLLWNWLGRARGDEGLIAFDEARHSYTTYVNKLQKRFDQLDTSDFAAARGSQDLVQAESLYLKASEHSAQIERSDNVTTANYQLGLLYHLQGRCSEAGRRLKLAASVFESSVVTDRTERAALSACYYHLGIIAGRSGDWDESRRLLNLSLQIDDADLDFVGVQMNREALKTIESWQAQGIDPTNAASTPLPESDAISPSLPDAAAVEPDRSETAPTSATDETIFASTYVIWLLSYSVDANDIYMSELQQHLDSGVPCKVRVERRAFGGPGLTRGPIPPLDSDERLCAAILILEPAGLADPTYLQWGRLCLNRVDETGDFRLFVGATEQGATLDELARHAGSAGLRLIAELVQKVQFQMEYQPASSPTPWSIPGPSEICKACRSCIDEFDVYRSQARCRSVRLRSIAVISRLAWLVQVTALLFLGLATFAYLVLGKDSSLTLWIHSHVEIAAVLGGILLFPLYAVPAFFLLRGMRAIHLLMERRADLRGVVTTCIVISAALSYLIDWVPTAWLLLGVGVGAVLDHVRREGFHARRARIPLLECLTAAFSRHELEQLLEDGERMAHHPRVAPLFPRHPPRIFISYARGTAWSEKLARGLRKSLDEQGTLAFADSSIRIGSGWLSTLNRCLSDADIFVSVIDAEATTRPWVMGEMVAAIRGRAVSGSPHIVVLTAPDMDSAAEQDVFAAVLDFHRASPDSRELRVLKTTELTLPMVARSLGSYQVASVVPASWSMLLQLPMLPIVSIGPLSELLGLPAGILLYLEYWNKTNVAGWLDRSSLLEASCWATAYLAGFSARLLVSMTCEVRLRHQRIGAPLTARALGTAGLAGLAILWCQHVNLFTSGWAIVLGCAGWFLAGHFISTVKKVRPEKFGAAEI